MGKPTRSILRVLGWRTRRQESERTPSRGIWKNPQPVDWSLISHSGPPALESLRKIIKDTDSLVSLVPPNQGPGVKA